MRPDQAIRPWRVYVQVHVQVQVQDGDAVVSRRRLTDPDIVTDACDQQDDDGQHDDSQELRTLTFDHLEAQ